MSYFGHHTADDGTESFHIIHIPPAGERGHYTSLMSLQWFSERESVRKFGPKKADGQWAHIGPMWNASNYIEYATKNDIPLIEHVSLWDFYKSIKYDYKKKKYIKA